MVRRYTSGALSDRWTDVLCQGGLCGTQEWARGALLDALPSPGAMRIQGFEANGCAVEELLHAPVMAAEEYPRLLSPLPSHPSLGCPLAVSTVMQRPSRLVLADSSFQGHRRRTRLNTLDACVDDMADGSSVSPPGPSPRRIENPPSNWKITRGQVPSGGKRHPLSPRAQWATWVEQLPHLGHRVQPGYSSTGTVAKALQES